VTDVKRDAEMAKRRRSSKALFPVRFSSEITRCRDGDTTKPDPLFILVINNVALERPFGSKNFIPDMSTSADRAPFNKAVEYINKNLFGELPRQAEKLLAASPHSSKIKLWSMYIDGQKPNSATSLVGEFGPLTDRWLKPRRSAVVEMLANIGMNPDVVFVVSNSGDTNVASALGATDDDDRGGIPATFDGRTITHRFYHKIPGMVAIHAVPDDMTPAHEFGHAFSSYSNGFVTDLYRDSDLYCHGTIVLNRKVGRPIPDNFAEYHGVTYLSDKERNSLGYDEEVATSYHSELVDRRVPALMDDYLERPMRALHDKMTKAYIMDRIAAKVSR
jgi:hypothetical protein